MAEKLEMAQMSSIKEVGVTLSKVVLKIFIYDIPKVSTVHYKKFLLQNNTSHF